MISRPQLTRNEKHWRTQITTTGSMVQMLKLHYNRATRYVVMLTYRFSSFLSRESHHSEKPWIVSCTLPGFLKIPLLHRFCVFFFPPKWHKKSISTISWPRNLFRISKHTIVLDVTLPPQNVSDVKGFPWGLAYLDVPLEVRING